MKLSEAEYILESLKPPASHEKKDLRHKKWKDLVESQTEATDYFSFCENLEIFCSKLQKKNVKYLLQNKVNQLSNELPSMRKHVALVTFLMHGGLSNG